MGTKDIMVSDVAEATVGAAGDCGLLATDSHQPAEYTLRLPRTAFAAARAILMLDRGEAQQAREHLLEELRAETSATPITLANHPLDLDGRGDVVRAALVGGVQGDDEPTGAARDAALGHQLQGDLDGSRAGGARASVDNGAHPASVAESSDAGQVLAPEPWPLVHDDDSADVDAPIDLVPARPAACGCGHSAIEHGSARDLPCLNCGCVRFYEPYARRDMRPPAGLLAGKPPAPGCSYAVVYTFGTAPSERRYLQRVDDAPHWTESEADAARLTMEYATWLARAIERWEGRGLIAAEPIAPVVRDWTMRRENANRRIERACDTALSVDELEALARFAEAMPVSRTIATALRDMLDEELAS